MQKSYYQITFSIVILLFSMSLAIPSITSAVTKQNIFSNILLIQKNSTENQIDESIEKILLKNLTNSNNQLVVNIQDFGAKGNGVDSDVDALKKANAYVSAKGGGNIYFPSTSQNYVIDNGVTISKNVNLIGEQTKIFRYHDCQVTNNRVFYFQGNNIMTGFIYDGGLTRIPNIGISNEFCYYVDFDAIGENCIFTNNIFLNAKGTFIGGGVGSTIVYNNKFSEYGDHCIYMGTGSSKDGFVYTKNVIVSNNTFTAATSTRDAVKFRNGGEMIIISNNTFDLPKGALFMFALGDNIIPQGNLNYISFSYNTITNCKDIGHVGVNNDPIGSALGKINNIKITNNSVDYCTGYLGIGGASWSVDSNIDYFSGTNIDISNNTFKKPPQIHLVCKGDGLKVNITNNKAYGHPTNYSFITLYGNTSLNLLNNLLDLENDTTLIDSPYYNSEYTSTTEGIKATTPQTITISGNRISGVRKIYQENSNQNMTYLTDKITFNLINNTYTKCGLAVSFDSVATQLFQANLSMSNNIVTLDGKLSTIIMPYCVLSSSYQ